MGSSPTETGPAAGAPSSVQPDDTAPVVEPESSERGKRRDQVATTLIGATATVAALLALLGASSDRVWVILDDSTAKKLMFATAFLVAITIALGLWALLADDPRTATRRLVAGSVAFVAAMTTTVWTASSGANQFARPSFTQVAVERASPNSTTLQFTVHAESVDASQRIGVEVVDNQQRKLFESTLPPNAVGVADQKVVLRLPVDAHSLHITAWHRDQSSSGSPEPRCEVSPLPDGTACVFVNL